jgi:hypothetical protein
VGETNKEGDRRCQKQIKEDAEDVHGQEREGGRVRSEACGFLMDI